MSLVDAHQKMSALLNKATAIFDAPVHEGQLRKDVIAILRQLVDDDEVLSEVQVCVHVCHTCATRSVKVSGMRALVARLPEGSGWPVERTETSCFADK